MIVKVFKILFWVFFIIGFILLSFVVNKDRQNLVITNYNIEIVDSAFNKFVLKKDVIRILKKTNDDIKGLNVSEINREELEKKLESHPSIDKCEVYMLSNSDLKIRIWQREPVLRVFASKSYYIDKNRKLMSLSNNYTKRVVVLTGNVTESMAKGILFDLCSYVEAHEFWRNYIGQININENNEIELVPLIGDFRIIMGTSENFEGKLKKLKYFLDSAQNHNIWGKYKCINLKYNNQIVCIK